MIGANHRARRFLGQFLVFEAVAVFSLEDTANHEVERALLQLFEQDVALLHVHADAQPGCVALDVGDRARHQRHGGRHDHADLDLANQPGAQRDHVIVGQAQAGDRHARVADHRFAVDGRLHAVRQALEQAHVEHVFEVLQLFRCRRLRHVQGGRCAMDVAMLVERNQQQQLSRLEPGFQEPIGIEGIHGEPISEWYFELHIETNIAIVRWNPFRISPQAHVSASEFAYTERRIV